MTSNATGTIIYERRSNSMQAKENIEQLEQFLSDLDGMINCGKEVSGNKISSGVFEAVKEMVEKILDVVGVLDPLMAVDKIHSVGSFKEGTKLGKPNEFDFVVEMASFGNVRTISVRDECHIGGAVHLDLSDTTSQMSIEHLLIEEESEQGTFKYLSPVKFRNRFWQLVTAVSTHLSQQNATIEKETGKLRLVKDVPQHLDMYDKGPNIEIFMIWASADDSQKFGISVDVTPSLRVFETVPETLKIDLDRLKHSQASRGSKSDVLLIPTINLECKRGELADYDRKLCWKLSFSLLETHIIQNLNTVHKRCLRILKHLKSNQKDGVEQMRELGLELDADPLSATIIKLQHNQGEMSLLSTYRMKMAVLEHDENCTAEKNTSAECLMEILKLLKQRVRQKFLPIFFIPTKNAWPRGPVLLLESSIDEIINLFQDIMKDRDYSFDMCFEKFLKVQTYLTDRDGV